MSLNNLETVSWEVLPYINKISEGTARLLAPFGIKISHRPTKTIGTQLIRPKDPLTEKDKSNGIYDIPCQDCDCHYVGETRKRHEFEATSECSKATLPAFTDL